MFNRKVFFLFFLLKLLLFLAFCLTRSNSKPPIRDTSVSGWDRDPVHRSALPQLALRTLLLPPRFCSQHLLLAVVVFSPPLHQERRRFIRRTWGMFVVEDVKVFFLLGNVRDAALQEDIELEHTINGDLIQLDLQDTYLNLTLKSVVMLKLAATHCTRTRFLLKADEDTFVNLFTATEMLSKAETRGLLQGYMICGQKPEKLLSTRRYTPGYLFSKKVFPSYLAGGAYLMSMDTVQRLYVATLAVPMIHLEDVFVTGICADKAKVRPRHGELLFVRKKKFALEDPCRMQEALAVFEMRKDEMDGEFEKVLLDHSYWKRHCVKKRFSCIRWIFDAVLKVTYNPFGYRENCL